MKGVIWCNSMLSLIVWLGIISCCPYDLGGFNGWKATDVIGLDKTRSRVMRATEGVSGGMRLISLLSEICLGCC